MTKKAFFHCIRDGKAYRGYKTGDAGYLKGGQLYYNGRIDLQVKLHGYRIEIEDIENNMVRLPQIDHQSVVPNLEEGKVKSLTAFVTGAQMAGKKASEISRQVKNGLKEFLPVYMIPKKIKYIETMPMNNHGKADRNILEVWQNEFLQRSTILWHIDSVIAFRIDSWLYGKEPALV